MKNAILPTSAFVVSSLILVWFENHASIEQIKRRDISVMQFEQESYENADKNKDEWLSSVAIQKQHYRWVNQFNTIEKLFSDHRFLALNEKQKIIARILYAKFILSHKPQQTVSILSALSEQQEKLFGTGFSLGLAYSRLGQTDSAINAYTRTLAHQRNHQGAVINLGILLKEKKEYQKAVAVLKQAIDFSSGKKLAKVYALLANCQEKLGINENAQLNYQKSIEYRPQHAASWLGLARMQQKNGEIYSEVVKNYWRAHRLNPNHFRPLFELGNYQLNNLDFVQAVKNLQLAVKLVPLQQNARRSLAWALFENRQLSKAKKQWSWLAKNEKLKYRRKFAQFMIEIIDDGENTASVESLVRQMLNNRKMSDSLKNEFEYLLLLSSVHPEKVIVEPNLANLTNFNVQGLKHLQNRARWHKAEWYSQAHLSELALTELEYLHHQPLSLATVEYKISEVYSDLGKLELAQSYIDKALTNSPQSFTYLIRKIDVLIERKAYTKARKALLELQKVYPDNNELAGLAAEISWQTDRLDEAKVLYQRLIELEHSNDIALYRLATIAHKQGDLTTAKLELENALLINSEFVPARYLLAKIFCEQGDIEQCRSQANKVLKLDNTHQQAKQLVNI